ncbi:uncharacterized protein LOC122369494 [Amphibalanus amphitrite]|uniref:uncharacterized protein LOC122369494 n=1 Tax=Amphibalanus amphitrite TaxID=1232801 RepID=UPI001C91665C|nr:uncharacterized protein LOC122369494 [Amphibalanus amphitrite]
MQLSVTVVLLAALAANVHGDLIEHFESGMGDYWVSWSDDNGGHWVWKNTSLMEVPQRPAGSEGVTMLIPDEGRVSAAGHLYSPLFAFPAGAKISFSYWIRSQWVGSANLILKLVENGQEDLPFLDLSSFAAPDNDQWRQAEAEVPSSRFEQTRICVFGYRANHDLDAIAVDDIVLTGVDGSQVRLPLSPNME